MDNFKGISKGVFSAITWAITTLISGIALSLPPFSNIKYSLIFTPLVAVFLHDFIGSIWLISYFTIKGELFDFFRAFKSKSAKYAILVGLCGGPLGMGGYYLSIKYIGSSYAAAISCAYPIMGAILAAIFLKEKLNKKSWLGLILGIIGVTLLSVNGNNGHMNIIGILFSLLPIIGWGSESVLCSIAMKNNEITPLHMLQIRFITSGVTFGIFVLPFIHGYNLIGNLIITNHYTLILCLTASLMGVISLSSYYSCIKDIGPVKSMILNMTYVIWSLIFSVLLLHSSITLNKIIYIFIILTGSILVILNNSNNEDIVPTIKIDKFYNVFTIKSYKNKSIHTYTKFYKHVYRTKKTAIFVRANNYTSKDYIKSN